MARQNITLQVSNTAGPLAGAHWSFGDGQQADGVTVSHSWATAQTYQVSVVATLPSGRQASTSVSVQVGTMPAPTQVSPADGTKFNDSAPNTTVTWKPITGAARYHVEIQCSYCEDSTAWRPWIDTTTASTSHTFSWPRDSAPRRWRVTAITADNHAGTSSGWWGFSYGNDGLIHPPKPKPAGPSDGSKFNKVPRTTTVSWRPQGLTEYYVLEVECFGCTTPGQWTQWLTKPVGSDSNPQTSYTFDFVGAFPARWHVKGVSATVTNGPWSDWWHFTYTT